MQYDWRNDQRQKYLNLSVKKWFWMDIAEKK